METKVWKLKLDKKKKEPAALADHEEDDLTVNKETAIVVAQEDTVKANQE